MATLNITIPDAAAPRIRAAFGRIRGLGRDATAAEVEQEIKNYLKGIVQDAETAAARDAITVPDTGL